MPLIVLSSNFTKLQNQAFSATNLHGNKAKVIQKPQITGILDKHQATL